MKKKNYALVLMKKLTVVIFGALSSVLEKCLELTTKVTFYATWFYDAPDYFDHKFDLYYVWKAKNSINWIDRGVLNSIAISKFDRPKVMELCCGDGFFTRMFYRNISDEVFAYDYCEEAIKHARSHYQIKGLQFEVLDINCLDVNKYKDDNITNVIFDAAIAYFSEKQTEDMLIKVKAILAKKKGIFSGTCPLNKDEEIKNTYQRFDCPEKLEILLGRYFNNVKVITIKYKERTNMHFYASDSIIDI